MASEGAVIKTMSGRNGRAGQTGGTGRGIPVTGML